MREWTRCVRGDKKQVDPIKDILFVIEKHLEDVRQDEKHVPDLLESIMTPSSFVKVELRPILFKMVQLGSKISKVKVSIFWIPEI